MRVVDVMQGTDKWLEFRRGGIGGSDIATCAGIKSFKNRKQLFREKCGLNDKYENDFMRRGTLYEMDALLKFNMENDCDLKPICLESEENTIYRCSLDGFGILNDKKVVLEIKVPTNLKLYQDAEKGIIPENYRMQIQWGMMISEADEGYLMVYKPEVDESVVVRVDVDLEYQNRLKEAANAFWAYFERDEIMPDPIPEIEDDSLKGLLSSFEELKIERDRLDKSLKALDNEIKSRADGEGFRAYGYTCKLMPGRPSYDYEAMSNDGIDLSKYIKPGKSFYVLRKENE